jgi:hypothetical protein
MGKIGCECGGVLSNSICPSPTNGAILREQDEQQFYSRVARDITAFIRSVAAGDRTSWIQSFFTPTYPTDLRDEDVVEDILSMHANDYFLYLWECTACGRLYAQTRNGENQYLSFFPDAPGYHAVLRSNANSDPQAPR